MTVEEKNERIARLETALREIADGYGPNHGSKYCRDVALSALTPSTLTVGK